MAVTHWRFVDWRWWGPHEHAVLGNQPTVQAVKLIEQSVLQARCAETQLCTTSVMSKCRRFLWSQFPTYVYSTMVALEVFPQGHCKVRACCVEWNHYEHLRGAGEDDDGRVLVLAQHLDAVQRCRTDATHRLRGRSRDSGQPFHRELIGHRTRRREAVRSCGRP